MLGRSAVLSRQEAQQRLRETFCFPVPPMEEIETPAALGRILGRPVSSPEDLPSFARSTMDGYAVRARDTFGASESMAAYLNVIGEIPMGTVPEISVGEMDAVRIATGGMLPAGADAVVMLEQTVSVDAGMVEVVRSVAPGENVIRTGDDVRQGQEILRSGRRIRPQDIGLLCGLGVTKIFVYRRPAVSVIPTGNEIVPPDQTPHPGQVRDINSFHLAALLQQAGARPIRYGVIPDDEDRLEEAVHRAVAGSDLVILSGGSSVGTRDLTEKVLTSLGEGLLFHGVAVKPGKPTLCALVKGRPVFGLPGHPAAVVIGYDLFVKPILQSLSGEQPPDWTDRSGRTVIATLTRSVSSRPGREDYLRVALKREGEEVTARPILGKSGLISTLVAAAGTVVIPEEKAGLEKGESVIVRLFPS
ncbi:MAG: molybdopterin molybdotransferase MoeA [Deltaproteobacteria bacterium]|nr:molybdopterin molybdotransferase MoeA [Deltaproteobacteria bacterium]